MDKTEEPSVLLLNSKGRRSAYFTGAGSTTGKGRMLAICAVVSLSGSHLFLDTLTDSVYYNIDIHRSALFLSLLYPHVCDKILAYNPHLDLFK